jgi:hypothetical protein
VVAWVGGFHGGSAAAATDHEQLAADIRRRFQPRVMTWFEPYVTLQAIEQRLTTSDESSASIGVVPRQKPIILAILRSVLGDQRTARDYINQALISSKGSGFEASVRKVSERLGLNVA